MLRLRTFSHESATEQAASWYARQRSDPLSQTDATEFTAWLKSDPANVTAWRELESVWDRVESVRDDPTILAIREMARRRVQRQAVVPHAWAIGVTLAACIVAAVAIWWGFKGTLPASSGRAAAALTRYASTEIGERSVVLLPDGSKVTLNTATAVQADYSGHERRVRLVGGEAFFAVAKDPTRPFIVVAESREVIAVGTSFDVRLQPRQLRVALIEGRVRVISAAGAATDGGDDTTLPVTLQPGTALVVNKDGVDRIEKIDTTRVTSWLNGKLIFEEERLADVVVEMNRYSRTKLEISNATLAERKVSGVFEATDALTLANALQDYGIVRITRQSVTAIVLDSPAKQHEGHQSRP